MKMRLKPLRGQTYNTRDFGIVKFLAFSCDGEQCTVVMDDLLNQIPSSQFNFPIIDTKDYEKIPDEKYRGD